MEPALSETPAPFPDAETSPDVLRTWFRFLRLHQRITARAAAEYRRIGLSIPQFDLLSTLSEREGISQQEVAERLYVTKGNVSGLLDRLAALGFVERRALPNDRRSYALYLTDEGRAMAPATWPTLPSVAHTMASGHQSRLASARSPGSSRTSAQASSRRARKASSNKTTGAESLPVADAAPPAISMGGVGDPEFGAGLIGIAP